MKLQKYRLKEWILLATLERFFFYLREYYDVLYANRLDNLDELDTFLGRHKLNFTQEEIVLNIVDL